MILYKSQIKDWIGINWYQYWKVKHSAVRYRRQVKQQQQRKEHKFYCTQSRIL